MFIFGKPKKNLLQKDLGDDFYLEYSLTGNGRGGFHPVNIVLKNHKNAGCNHVITNKCGRFKNFPGTKKGRWVNELEGNFSSTVNYTLSVSKFVDGISYVSWLVQPDGMYFADEDGFGAEDCTEIKLYSMMNTKGKFLCPFTDEYMKGCGGCSTL